MCRVSNSLFQALRQWERRESMGIEDAKVKGGNSPSSPQLPPFFSCSRYLNSPGPTISEPGTGCKSTVYAHCIFVVIGSLFLKIRLHLLLNNIQKKKRSQRRIKVVSDHYKLTQLGGILVLSKFPNSIRVEGFNGQKISCCKLAAPHDDGEQSILKTKQNKTTESKRFVF